MKRSVSLNCFTSGIICLRSHRIAYFFYKTRGGFYKIIHFLLVNCSFIYLFIETRARGVNQLDWFNLFLLDVFRGVSTTLRGFISHGKRGEGCFFAVRLPLLYRRKDGGLSGDQKFQDRKLLSQTLMGFLSGRYGMYFAQS